MKTKNLIERLSLFLLALVLTMPTWAQGGNGTEVVSIGSKAEWKAFCQRVNNNGEPFLNAKLTRDVDLGEEIVMVGSVSYPYSGTFDGNGHTLKFNWNAGKDNQIAPFWYVKDATIKNLRTQGKITSKGYGLSGMVYIALGTTTITGCISDVDITGGRSGLASSNAAGMVQAVAYGASVHITDCLVKGSITDNAAESERTMGGFVFYNGGTYTLTRCLYVGKNNAPNNGGSYTFGTENGISATFTDCYYLNTCDKAQGKQVTAERLKSGEMAKLLQGDRTENVWGQTLGTDNEPLPTTDATKRVYEVKFNYNGHTFSRYANSGQGVHGGLPTAEELLGTGYNPHHYYAIAFADGFNASTPVNADRKVDITLDEKDCYEISTKADWKAFCDLVNSGQNTVDAKMTKDVDLGEDITMAGTNRRYSGTFDGQNHTLKINWNSGDRTWIAPFQTVYGATIKNLRTEGEINSSTHFLSGLVHEAYGNTTISGCVSAVNITSSYNEGGCDAAGIIECVRDNAKVTITDCVVKGKFHATTENGRRGISGFVNNQYGTCTLTNCLYIGENNATGGYTFCTNYFSGTTLNNCYYLNTCGKAQGTQVTKEQLKNGYVAHKLQGTREETVWGQVLGTDHEPQLTDKIEKRVYKVKFIYNGRVKATRYANSGQTVSLPTAQEFLGEAYNPANTYKLIFDGDFSASTPVNSDRTIDVVVAESCEISSKADWQAFCNRVNGGETAINAKLMNDVDLGEEITMAGTSRNYNGTFDGQGHTLTLNWNSQSGEVAPFKFVNNATIKNLRVKGKIKSDGRTLSALVCNAVGNVTLSGCVSEVDITSNYHGTCELAGMIAYVNDRAEVAITDCVVKGAFNSMATDKKGMAGFVYLQTGYCTLTNCLYAGTNNATAGSYTFGSNTIRKNCYYLNACGKAQDTQITEKQLKSGEVAYKLQGDRTDSCHWAQVLGEKTPSLYREADRTKPNYVYYNKENNGWTCDDFRLTDGQSLPIGLDFTATKATYDRTLAAGKATLCLPYELPVQGFKAYTLSGGDNSAVHFADAKDKLEAYKPYLITADGVPQLGGENIQVKAYKADVLKQTAAGTGHSFTGTVAGLDNAAAANANAYILQDDGKFHKVTTDYPTATVPAYHAYVVCPKTSGAKQLSIIIDGETTGLRAIETTDQDGTMRYYDLQGRYIGTTLQGQPKGIYIGNGKKIVH